MMNQEVPLEAVLKYIKQDRDKYKEKLETLMEYTKSLETRILEMTAEMNVAREEYAKNIEKARKEERAACGENKNKRLKAVKKMRAGLNMILEGANQIELKLIDYESE